MWNIKLDESFVLDYLSILSVKHESLTYLKRKEEADEIFVQISTLLLDIGDQFGHDKLRNILHSFEYSELMKANSHVFSLMNEASISDKLDLSNKIYEGNLDRWRVKKDIQKKFFGKEFSEIKIGGLGKVDE